MSTAHRNAVRNNAAKRRSLSALALSIVFRIPPHADAPKTPCCMNNPADGHTLGGRVVHRYDHTHKPGLHRLLRQPYYVTILYSCPLGDTSNSSRTPVRRSWRFRVSWPDIQTKPRRKAFSRSRRGSHKWTSGITISLRPCETVLSLASGKAHETLLRFSC